MTKDEALDLALEALESQQPENPFSLESKAIAAIKQARSAPVQEPVAKDWEGAEYWMPLAWELCADECGEDACNDLIWEGGPIPEPWGDRWLKYEDEAKRLIALVQKHTTPPAQPAPVQERNFCERCGKRLGSGIHTCTPSAQPAFVQEPVADVYMAGSMKTNIGTNGRVVYVSTVYSEKPLVKGDKLYTAPPAAQRQWVGLTETEFEALHWKAKGYVATGLMDVVRMVEAKLKEKNT